MDVRDMKDFKDETFDLIIDKSTTDAILCGDQSFINVAFCGIYPINESQLL